MNLKLEDKTALVTASSGGIGQAIATSLAREGARVIINGRSASAVDKAITAIRAEPTGAKLLPLAADNDTAEGCAATIAAYPEVDILGIYEAVGFFDETDEAWQKMYDVNIMSGVRLARHYLAEMLERLGPNFFHRERIRDQPGTGDGALQRDEDDAAFHLAEPGGIDQGLVGYGECLTSRPHLARRGGEVHPRHFPRRAGGRSRQEVHGGEPPDLADRPPDRAHGNRRFHRLPLQPLGIRDQRGGIAGGWRIGAQRLLKQARK